MTGPRLLSLIAIALAVMCTALVLIASSDILAAHLVIRWTARSSLVLFLLAYIARPACQLRPRPMTKTLLAQRKWIGLGFATSHTFHLAGIIALARPDFGAFARSQSPVILVALLAYVVMFAMAITSITAVKKRMPSRTWKRLHRFGMHLLWIPFASTYVGAMFASPIFAIPAAAVLAAAVLRFAAWRRSKRRANTG